MISFIVIGRNEEKNLKRCFESIFTTIEYNKIKDYEIVYVDSKSTDKSIEIVKSFTEVKIFCITGEFNTAIARNIGANESKGNILFFIDGDMELNTSFLSSVLDKNGQMKYSFVSGQLVDVVKGAENEQTLSSSFLPGGIFLIDSKEWRSLNGMRTKFKTGEDLDLGLRLHKKGCRLVRKSEVIANHHTIPYLHRSRIWKMVWNKSLYCSRCVLYRNHICNIRMYHLLWLSDKTFILLLFTIAFSFIVPTSMVLFISIYLLAVIIRSFKQKNYISRLEFVSYYIVFDLLNLFFLLTFFPKNKKICYIKIHDKEINVDKILQTS